MKLINRIILIIFVQLLFACSNAYSLSPQEISSNALDTILNDKTTPLDLVIDALNTDPSLEINVENWGNPDASRSLILRAKDSALKIFNQGGNQSDLIGTLGSIGKQVKISSPIFFDLGNNIYLGNRVQIGSGVVFLDIAKITVGDDSQIENDVHLCAVGHKVNPEDRVVYDYSMPIKVGKNVRIGSGSIILMGTVIEDNVIVLPGSVVSGHIKANSTIAGVPAKELTENTSNSDYFDLYQKISEKMNGFNNYKHSQINPDDFGYFSNDSNVMAHFCCNNPSNVFIQGGVFVNVRSSFDSTSKISIGKNSQLAPGVLLVTNYDGISDSITIESDVWIGTGAIIMPGVTVKRGSIVGAGAIITSDVAPNTLVVGNGKVIGTNLDEQSYWSLTIDKKKLPSTSDTKVKLGSDNRPSKTTEVDNAT